MELLLLMIMFVLFVPVLLAAAFVGAGVGMHLSERVVKYIKSRFEDE